MRYMDFFLSILLTLLKLYLFHNYQNSLLLKKTLLTFYICAFINIAFPYKINILWYYFFILLGYFI